MAAETDLTDAPVMQLDERSSVPKYLQIAAQVKALVARGALAPGAPLPSVRQLAGDLGINVNTVLTSYRALEAEGIIQLRHGARARIHPQLAQPRTPSAADLAQVRAALERIRTESVLLGVRLETLRSLAREVFEG